MKQISEDQTYIITAIVEYLHNDPEVRFGQALCNLNINEFANKEDPESNGFLLRDNYDDSDASIVKRLKNI